MPAVAVFCVACGSLRRFAASRILPGPSPFAYIAIVLLFWKPSVTKILLVVKLDRGFPPMRYLLLLNDVVRTSVFPFFYFFFKYWHPFSPVRGQQDLIASQF